MNSQLSANAPGGYTRRAIFVSPGNQNYQRQMAESLVAAMGVGRAVGFALENGWEDVVALLQNAGDTARS